MLGTRANVPSVGYVFRIACLIALAVGCGIAIGTIKPDLAGAGILAIACVLALPIARRIIRGSFDPFEPNVVMNFALAVMFVVRPTLDLATGSFDHLGHDVAPTFNSALLVALVGILTFQLGYALPWGRGLGERVPPMTAELTPRRVAWFALAVFALGTSLYSIFLITSGGVAAIALIASGRDPADYAVYLGSSGYLYRALLLTVPGALALLAIAFETKRARFIAAAALVGSPALALASATGGRTVLLLIAGGATVLWYLARHKRPGAVAFFVAILILAVGIGFIRQVRTSSSDIRAAGVSGFLAVAADPPAQLFQTLSGGDDDMFDSFANELQIVPSEIAFAPGSFIGDIFIRAIPRPLWADKPLERSDLIVATLWSAHYAKSRGSPAFSILGPLYADSGIIGVVVGMLLIGICARTLWGVLQTQPNAHLVRLFYATSLPILIVLARGTLPDTLSYVLFMTVPLVALGALSRRLPSAQSAAPTPAISGPSTPIGAPS